MLSSRRCDEIEEEKLLRAGRIAKKVLDYAINITKPGVPVIEICNQVEKRIIELGGKPAFPCNVSIDDIAAHYSSPIEDKTVIPEGALVKIDVGVHIDGYIADTAKTICFNQQLSDLVESAEEALNEALCAIKAGVEVRKISSIIEKTIKRYGFKPIKNLSGHLMKRYLLHGGKSIPNIAENCKGKILEGEVYAIEPFSTTGVGMVGDLNKAYIYNFIKVKGANNKREKKFLKVIKSKFRNLPFSERWLVDFFPSHEVKLLLKKFVKEGALHEYPVLREISGGIVAQAEHTVIVKRDGVIITTK